MVGEQVLISLHFNGGGSVWGWGGGLKFYLGRLGRRGESSAYRSCKNVPPVLGWGNLGGFTTANDSSSLQKCSIFYTFLTNFCYKTVCGAIQPLM